jgi:protein-tyrosine phosphatase
MPGRFEPWPTFRQEAAAKAIAQVLCLTPLHEIEHLSPAYKAAIDSASLPFRWTHLPMQDFGLAVQAGAFHLAIEDVAGTLCAGQAVLLHCAAGIGRTGTAAACLLKHLGDSTLVAMQRVRDAGSNPESALQSGLVASF